MKCSGVVDTNEMRGGTYAIRIPSAMNYLKIYPIESGRCYASATDQKSKICVSLK